MYAPTFVIAILLITAPEPPSPIESGRSGPIRDVIRNLALQWELLDPREERFLKPEDFATDLAVVRRRVQELWDAPRLHEGIRFPDKNSVNQMLAFNRSYKRHLDLMKPLLPDQQETVRAALRETDQLYQVWDKVHDARSEIYYVPVRRLALKHLRDLVGPEAYYTGRLPPHVPVWRFQEVK